MIANRIITAALVVFLLISGLAIAWAAQGTVASHGEDGDISVETAHSQYEPGDTIRIWIRNVGDDPITGTPRLLVLDENGGVQQSFSFAQFTMELSPRESVWVDWVSGPTPAPTPCTYGKADTSGAPQEGMMYPCPEPMMPNAGIDDGMVSGATSPDRGVSCYGCRPYYGVQGTFILVGIFGERADAAVVKIAP